MDNPNSNPNFISENSSIVTQKTKIKLKHLIELLEDIEPFEEPKEELEQYQTNASIAGEMLHYISNNTPGFDKAKVLDMGCGTGILGIAACLCGAAHVTLLDLDDDAIEIAKRNIKNFELDTDTIEIVKLDVNSIPESFFKQYDIVITNPPFGIRSKKSADVLFLKKGVNISSRFIYSLHKFETFEYLKNFYIKQCGVKKDKINGFKIDYDLPKSYKFHKKADHTKNYNFSR